MGVDFVAPTLFVGSFRIPISGSISSSLRGLTPRWNSRSVSCGWSSRRWMSMTMGSIGTEPSGPSSTSTKTEVNTVWNSLNFDNSFVRELPGDRNETNHVRQVMGAAYSRVQPTPAWRDAPELEGTDNEESPVEPVLVAWSKPVAEILGLDSTRNLCENQELVKVLGGVEVAPGMEPFAQCYGGHQFGSWAGQLGDGRAITLAEIVNSKGERWEIQLKGAGRTPYSRFADGRAVLRSSIREFLCSEAMSGLGIPTTRALSLVETKVGVVRDQFYNGNPRVEPGAIVCRVAPSFLRLGSFELPASRGDIGLLTKLADYAILTHFPDLLEKGQPQKTYAAFLQEVIRRTCRMIAQWQGVGFVHGVANTDNYSILGLTIDYGPYGFLDAYVPQYTPNTTDLPGRRYCYEKQPIVGQWNMLMFAQALIPLTGIDLAQEALNSYREFYQEEYASVMRKKLGLEKWNDEKDSKFLDELLNNMKADALDFTNFWRNLSRLYLSHRSDSKDLLSVMGNVFDKVKEASRRQKWDSILRAYLDRVSENKQPDSLRREAMNRVNPKFILRNYLAQVAIEQAELGEYSELEKLYMVLQNPFEEHEDLEDGRLAERFTQEPPTWASRPGVCVNSCSS